MEAGARRHLAARQRRARLDVAPGPLARNFVARPKATCCVAALLPVLALAAVAATRSFELSDPTYRDYLIRGSERVRVDDARRSAREDGEVQDVQGFLDGGGLGGTVGGGDGGEDVVGSVEDSEMKMGFIWRAVGKEGGLGRDYEARREGGNVLTRENVAEMKRLEDEMVSSEGYERFCFRDLEAKGCDGKVYTAESVPCAVRQSITAHPLLYGIVGENEEVCGVKKGAEVVSAAEFKAFLESIATDAEVGAGERAIVSLVRPLLGRDANETAVPETFVARSLFAFGLPIAGYSSAEEDETEQKAEFKDWIVPLVSELEEEALGTEEGDLRLILVGEFYANSRFGETAIKDLSYAVAAILLVLLFMWAHTGSLFLAGAAMLQVILAFPLSFAFYRLVAQIKYFSSLQIMTIFLLLGIAADDAFVFVDAWKQSAVVLGADCDLVRRMSWTYRRSVKAMAVTSFTTALAFLFTAVSPVMPVGTLGYWASFLVLLQYVLVITMFPCAVIMWHRSLRPRKLSTKFRVGDPPVLVTRDDDENYLQEFEGTSSAGESVVDSGLQEAEEADEGVTAANVPRVPFWKRCRGGGHNENEYRAVERFFRYKWVNWIEKVKYVLLAVALLLIGVSVYFATQLQPLLENEEFLSKNNPLLIATSLQQNAFPNLNGRYTISAEVFWGVLDIDRSGTSYYDPNAIGQAEYDDSFDLKPAAVQQHLLDACDRLQRDKELGPTLTQDDPVTCWVRDFAAWRKSEQDKDSFETYASAEALGDELRSFFSFTNVTSESQPYLKYLTDERVVFSEDGERVVFTEISFLSDIKDVEPERVTWPYYQSWQAAVDELAAKAPEGVNKPLVTLGYASMWAVTTRTLIRNAFIGVGIMLSVALVILSLSTANVIVALFAFVSIGGIVTNLLALIQLWGFQMGLTESVTVIIAAGVSFDFCSHIANAYTESPASKRFDRTRDALTDLGISVLAGGLSTMISAATLFLATITFFQKFARFVVSTVALSLVWSLALMIAMLLIAGPENETGSLKPIFRKLTPRLGRRKAKDDGSEEESSDSAGTAGDESPTLESVKCTGIEAAA